MLGLARRDRDNGFSWRQHRHALTGSMDQADQRVLGGIATSVIRRRRSSKGLRAFAIPLLLGLVGLGAGAAIAYAILTHRTSNTPVITRCSNSQCAVVNVVHTSPVLTQYYGQSCQGLHGAWYLNVSQGGGAQVLRPSYRLSWSFAEGSLLARPSGSVDFAPTDRLNATGTLMDGVLSIKGTGLNGAPVSGQGTLTVQLSGPATAPTLTLTETGLTNVEEKLGFQSPFVASGGPVTIQIQILTTAPGCNAH